MAIHDINMDDTCAPGSRTLDLVREVGKIRRKNGGCEFDELPDQIRVQDVGSEAVEILARWREGNVPVL